MTMFFDSLNLVLSEHSCFLKTEECVCGDLSEGVKRQGYCVNTLQELVAILDFSGDFVATRKCVQ